eukprot:TRINITY_DN27365_c0_g1_i1.p1 TRINITY_DN27365_c0_g1~~TRINITY_DN27365_c0_g1_i1.p1  ORF type:complete len:106 (+),score=23.89 TRINITY_DN27365_c0_g1_i1:8-325(+)
MKYIKKKKKKKKKMPTSIQGALPASTAGQTQGLTSLVRGVSKATGGKKRLIFDRSETNPHILSINANNRTNTLHVGWTNTRGDWSGIGEKARLVRLKVPKQPVGF